MPESTAVTFESGYEQLKHIVDRLDADDVSVHESCELFAQGKGLENALRTYLTEQKGKLDDIEAGNNLPEFRIVAPDDGPAVRPADVSDFDSDFEGEVGLSRLPPVPPVVIPPIDDEIPF